jgi:MYXO-CTERM domain-containing protein
MNAISRWLSIPLLASGLLVAGDLRAEVYEVGPGRALESVGAVPWESLQPGDEVRIHWRAEPYREKFVIGRSGTAEAPITVRGVAGPAGQRPVLDGRDATTRAALNYWNEARGLIKIGGSNSPPDSTPAHIVVEGLSLRSARPPYGFTGRDGASDYADNAAAVYIEKGEHIVLRDLELHDSGNGLFCGAQTRDLLVEHCHIHDNGIEGSIYQHNNYTEALGIVFQYNHFGPLRDGCPGNNLKDRSAGLVVRANWIEGGNRQLDLVDAEGSQELVEHPSYGQTFVYGNVLIEPAGAGNSQIVHYGGDSGTTADYRKGSLYFHHNTVVSTRDGNTTLFRLSTDDESADCRNNIAWVSAAGERLAMLDAAGRLILRHNWFKTGWRDSHSGLSGSIDDDGSNPTGEAPGFVDAAGGDFHLAADSTCIDAAGPLAEAAAEHRPATQYVVHAAAEPRGDDGQPDIGAFERCPPGGCTQPDGGLDGADGGDGGPDAGADAGGDIGPDGGDPGSDGAADGGADPGADPGADRDSDDRADAGDQGEQTVSGGCGCASRDQRPAAGWGLLAGLLLLLARRRPTWLLLAALTAWLPACSSKSDAPSPAADAGPEAPDAAAEAAAAVPAERFSDGLRKRGRSLELTVRGARRVRAGDHVDVLSTLINPRLDAPVTITLMQNVIVLAPPERQPGEEPRHSLTLMVLPDEADFLVLADKLGRLHVTLRNPEDTSGSAKRTRVGFLSVIDGHRNRDLTRNRIALLEKQPPRPGRDAGSAGQTEGFRNRLPVELRAISIPVSGISHVAPGDRVDLLSTLVDRKTEQLRCQTLLTRLDVLAVEAGFGLTLLVSPEEAEILVQASRLGELTATLRNPNDEDDAFFLDGRLSPVTVGTLITGERIQPLRSRQHLIEVIQLPPDSPDGGTRNADESGDAEDAGSR